MLIIFSTRFFIEPEDLKPYKVYLNQYDPPLGPPEVPEPVERIIDYDSNYDL